MTKNGQFPLSFSINGDLHKQHQNLLARAEKLGFEIDLTNDFRLWFGKQLRSFSRQVDRIESGSVKLKMKNDSE